MMNRLEVLEGKVAGMEEDMKELKQKQLLAELQVGSFFQQTSERFSHQSDVIDQKFEKMEKQNEAILLGQENTDNKLDALSLRLASYFEVTGAASGFWKFGGWLAVGITAVAGFVTGGIAAVQWIIKELK